MNFFVGENSTGKSSILSLIKIITKIYFWFDFEFKTDEVNLGHAQDIISVSATDKSYFRIGYLNKSIKQKNGLLGRSFFLSFKNKNGTPELQTITLILDNGVVVHIKLTGSSILFKLDKNLPPSKVDKIEDLDSAIDVFRTLSSFHKDGKGYSTAKTDDKIDFKKDPRLAITFALEQISNKNTDKSFASMYFDLIYHRTTPIWLAPIRSKPKRTYDEPINEFSAEGEHTPYLLSSIVGSIKTKDIQVSIEKTAHNSGLFKKIELKRYGRSKNSPFELDVILDEQPLSIVNVGYGVSQSLPIVAEILSREQNSSFIIQQPEVHLHPKAQAEIGSLLYSSVENQGQTFFVETHSDYMIDRYRLDKFRAFKSKGEDTKGNNLSNSQILFFERHSGKNTVHPISINEMGEISTSQPNAYREFFINEQMELLGL
jgi:predicted ATPase